jgi:hypothetical protein
MKSIALLAAYSPLEARYQQERKADIAKHAHLMKGEVFSLEEIEVLPEPVRRYFHHCGYLGKEKMINADIHWSESYIKFAPRKSWSRMTTRQFNAIPGPMRTAYMRVRFMGVIPFEGRDLYREGCGNMRAELMSMFTLFNDAAPEIAQSALITIFAETLFLPNYALQPNISWEARDELSAKAYLRDQDRKVSGVFHFNASGEFIRFETEDRYYRDPKGSFRQAPFHVTVHRYLNHDGIRIPSEVSAAWRLEDGDFEYYRGTISGISYNVKH